MKAAAARWLVLLPATIGAWCLVLFGSVVVHVGIAGFCPPSRVVSGLCTDPTIQTALQVLEHVSVALSAAVVLAVAHAVAPSHKTIVLWSSVFVGLVAAASMAWLADAWHVLPAALLGGFLAAAAITSRVRRHAARVGGTPMIDAQSRRPGDPPFRADAHREEGARSPL